MNHKLKVWGMIAIGGAAGSMLRWMLSWLIQTSSFPYETLLVNLIGSFLLGCSTASLAFKYRQWLHIAFGIGFCGSFTTMSMFSLESTFLLQEGLYINALVYIFISLFGTVLLALGGYLLTNFMMKKRLNP